MPQTKLVHDWSTGSLIVSEIEVPDDQIPTAGNPPPVSDTVELPTE